VGHDLSLYVYITLLYRESSEQQLIGEDQMSRNYSSTIVTVLVFFDGFRWFSTVG
jgi:hypothetical protein